MKNGKTLLVLTILIGLLAAFAALAGFFWPRPGAPTAFTSARGEAVTLSGSGLYAADTISSAAQMQGNDLVTLTLGLPLLVVATYLAQRGSLRGRFLLTGTLGFFLYTYASMAFLTAYNELFLVYVALFSLSLFAFVLAMMSIDVADLPRHFSPQTPRRAIAAMLYFVAAFLTLAWLGRIIPPLLNGTIPPLDNTTTLVIQALDLGVIVPAAFLSATLLLKRNPWGYLLGTVVVMKFLTMGAAVSMMGVMMARRGVPVTIIETVIFPAIVLINLYLAVRLLRSIDSSTTSILDPERN
jgi:hypothetical protein